MHESVLNMASGVAWNKNDLNSHLVRFKQFTARLNGSQYIANDFKLRNSRYNLRNIEVPIKDLLTECEVCTGKYCLRFSYRPSDEGARAIKTEGNTFPYRPSKRG